MPPNNHFRSLFLYQLFLVQDLRITEEHQPVRLELPNSIKAILLSEEDYNSMVETLYLLGNSANADRLREGILQHKLGKVKEIDVTAYLD